MIRNTVFNLGDKFRGLVNNCLLTVEKVELQPVRTSKGVKDEIFITFKDLKGKNFKTSLNHAKRLLLERI